MPPNAEREPAAAATDAAGEAGRASAATAPAPRPPAIEIAGASRTFTTRTGKTTAFEDVSLSIEEGEFLCLCGPSGCGKSTLLSTIAGLEPVDAGEVRLGGKPIDGPGPDRTVMFQEHALFPWRTVAGNVGYPLELAGWDAARIDARVGELLRLVHLSRWHRAFLHELSGGMRQRVSLARALACDPKVLLMDEPFAALDAQTRDLLLGELQRIWQEARKTIVFVTHNVREAVVLGTRVAVMATRPGRIKRIFDIDLPRPRSFEDRDVALLAARVHQDLKAEIERVVREELGDDYRSPASRVARPPGGPLGGGI